MIAKCPVVDGVLEVALFLEAAQYGAHGRIFERPIQLQANLFSRHRAQPQNDREDVSLQPAQFSRIMVELPVTEP